MKSTKLSALTTACMFALSGCSALQEAEPSVATAPNFLILIGDDMGKETLDCYDVGTSPAHTPNLSKLCASGAVFDNFWTQPFCSPTRATLLTGEYSFRNGVVSPVMPNLTPGIAYPDPPADANPELRVMKPEQIHDFVPAHLIAASRGLRIDQSTLPNELKAQNADYATGAFGKWHLADPVNGATSHPQAAGFDTYRGFLDGTMLSHFAWIQVVDGEETPVTGYFSSHIVNDAIDWIAERDEPWLAWVAFSAPHDPFHLPPTELLGADSAALDPTALELGPNNPYFLAAIEAMDTEIGRLLASIPEDELANTYVMFISDNGSPSEVASAPYTSDTVKATVFQGGVDMPMIVSGPGVSPGRYSHLANSTDVFQTVLDLAGRPASLSSSQGTGTDSVSFAAALLDATLDSPRDWIYADGTIMETVPLDRAIRNQRYKFVTIKGEEHFFDLEADPYERNNLLLADLSPEQSEAYQSLKATMAELN